MSLSEFLTMCARGDLAHVVAAHAANRLGNSPQTRIALHLAVGHPDVVRVLLARRGPERP